MSEISCVPNYRVFFSHGGDDTYVVQTFLKPKLEETGATVFLDAGQIQYGDDFRAIILDELRKCDELLVLFTRSSLQRPWVLAEVGATLIRDKRIIAVRYGATEEELGTLGITSLLGTSHILHLDNFERYVSQLSLRVRNSS